MKIINWAIAHPFVLMFGWYVLSVICSGFSTPKPTDPQWKKSIYVLTHLIAGSWGRFAPMLGRRFPQLLPILGVLTGVGAVEGTESPAGSPGAPSTAPEGHQAPVDPQSAPEQSSKAAGGGQ